MTPTILISNIHITLNIHCHNIPRQEHNLCLMKPGPRPASLAVHHPRAGSEGLGASLILFISGFLGGSRGELHFLPYWNIIT